MCKYYLYIMYHLMCVCVRVAYLLYEKSQAHFNIPLVEIIICFMYVNHT